ncbi:hypothetical protein HY933_04325 [Candidatus Falkowbacteria bacterium]|nr:hypothetical protein [Candidatus Falkowbacteria bacterium]
MMKRSYRKIFILITLTIMVVLTPLLFVSADEGDTAAEQNLSKSAITNLINGANTGAGYNTEQYNLLGYVAKIFRLLLVVVTMVMFFLIIYAGVLWMTAQGNEEQIGKAKSILIGAVIGLAIVFAAGLIPYIIFYFFYDQQLI